MVSNAIDMELRDLLAALRRIKKEYVKDPEYKELRSELPKSWPV